MSDILKGRIGLVTGSGSGIGRMTAQVFAREGCSVVVSDIDEAGGNATVAAIRAAGGTASFVAADVGIEHDVMAMMKFALDTYGGLDVAVNNAGVEPDFKPIHELPLASWEDNIRVNLTGVFLCMKHEIGHMRTHGGGAIVNISSMAAVKSAPMVHVYSAAKRGVLALTSCSAIESAKDRIRVNAIMPGGIETPRMEKLRAAPDVFNSFMNSIPLGALGVPDNIAQAALWLCSDAACYVTGQTLAVDGGVTA